MNEKQIKKIQNNIPKIYVFCFFQTFLVIMPVIVPFWENKGLTLQDIFSLQGVFAAALIIFDAPAGYLADLFGRKNTLLIGTAVSAVGFQILWFGHTFHHFVIYELVLGLGLSLQSGCDVAILYNSLDALKSTGRKASFLGRRITAQTIGEGFASLLGGFLAGIALNLPAYANAVTAWVPVLVAFTLTEPEGQKLPRNSHWENLKSIRKALFGHSRLLTFAIVSFIFYGFATYCAVWSFQPYWKTRGLSLSMYGYLWAANNFMVALVSGFASAFEERFGGVVIVLIIAFLPIVGYFGMGFTPGLWGLAFTMAFPICRGLNQVIFQDAINNRVPSQMRATANSVGSLGMRALFIIFGPIIGFMLDRRGPDQAMVVLGAVYVLGFFLVAIPLLTQRRNFRVE